jgi:hypothetical protein
MNDNERAWKVVDVEVPAGSRIPDVFRGNSERECAEWIGLHPDRDKVFRGGFGIDEPNYYPER